MLDCHEKVNSAETLDDLLTVVREACQQTGIPGSHDLVTICERATRSAYTLAAPAAVADMRAAIDGFLTRAAVDDPPRPK